MRAAFTWKVRAEAYPAGGAAVLRGPLQFAAPLRHRMDVIREYPGESLCDYDVHPVDVAEGWRVPVLDSRAPDLGLALERRAGDGDHPWDEAPVALRSGGVTLVPLGCTLLRRADLPIR